METAVVVGLILAFMVFMYAASRTQHVRFMVFGDMLRSLVRRNIR